MSTAENIIHNSMDLPMHGNVCLATEIAAVKPNSTQPMVRGALHAIITPSQWKDHAENMLSQIIITNIVCCEKIESTAIIKCNIIGDPL